MSREPVKNTCPDIDRIISAIESARKDCDYSSDETLGDLQQRLTDVDHHLWRLDDALEKLRSANLALREWGNREAKDVDDLEARIVELESELEQKISI